MSGLNVEADSQNRLRFLPVEMLGAVFSDFFKHRKSCDAEIIDILYIGNIDLQMGQVNL